MVEEVGVEGQKAFRSMEELVRLLQGSRMKREPGRGLCMPTRRARSQGEPNDRGKQSRWDFRKEGAQMYKNVLLMRNGCEGCSMETCLGVLLAESRNAKVTAVYVTGDFTWKELRNIYDLDELKWPGAARVGKDAMAAAERRKVALAEEALEATEKMCARRGVPCEMVHLSGKSPLRETMKLAEERRCDLIVTSAHPDGAIDMQSRAKAGRNYGKFKIPVLIHHVI